LKQGLVSFGVDTNNGVSIVIDQRTIDAILELSPAPNELFIRLPVSADLTTGKIDMDAWKQVLQLYKQNNLEVGLILHNALECRYTLEPDPIKKQALGPNAALGPDPSQRFLNDYINKFSLSAASFLQGLGDLCPATVWVGNEPNLDSSALKQGQNSPPTTGGFKPSSMAPEVFGSLLYMTAVRIRAMAPQVENIYTGSLSCLIKEDTDPKGPFIGDYISKALSYLESCGVKSPFPFNGITLNMEGNVTDKYAAYAASVMTDIKTKYGLTGPSIVGEWGVANGSLDPVEMGACYQALCKYFALICFFQLYTMKSHQFTSYGCLDWTIQDGIFVPLEHAAWFDVLQGLLASYQKLS
jgi:hypothetical protein